MRRPPIAVPTHRPGRVPTIRALRHELGVAIVLHDATATRVAIILIGVSLAACGSDGGGSADPVASVPSGEETAVAAGATSAATASGASGSAATAAVGETSAPASSAPITASATLKAHALGTLTASGPVVVDGRSGVTISGQRITNPSGPCIIVRNGATNVRISGNQIGPCGGHGIEIVGASAVSVTRNNLSSIGRTGIRAVEARSVQVRNNFVDTASTAIRVIRSTQVEVEFNGGLNVRGPMPDGQLVQLDNVTGGGNRVQCNAADLSIGAPDPATTPTTPTIRTEDIISTWQSRGEQNDPILVGYNRVKGGGSYSGSGIMAGDGGGAYISVIGNRVVNPWNAGIAVSSGEFIRVERNRVFTDMPRSVTGEGFYVRNFYPTACSNIVHAHNEIQWIPDNGSAEGWSQAYWQPAGQCTNVTGTSTNNLSAPLTRAIFTEPIPECRARAGALGLSTSGY
jgi:hypothetical protein